MMDPPMFKPEQDLLIWRKKVATWVDLVTTAANKGPDRTYKSIAATLALHLHERGLPQAQKSIVDEVQVLGKVDYKQDDQIKAVQEVVNLVAVDPPIAVVTRLRFNSFNKVTNCKKKGNENLNTLLSRYRGLAAEHLMRVGATTSSHVGEILAVTLLQNANLPESNLTNAKINLIQLAETRKRDEAEEPFLVAAKFVSSILEAEKELDEVEKSLDNDVSSQGEGPADVLISTLPVIASVNKKLKDPLKELNQASSLRSKEQMTRSITTTGPRCVLSLDDAVSVLRSLAQTVTKVDDRSKDSSKASPADEIQKALNDQLRSFYSSEFFDQIQ